MFKNSILIFVGIFIVLFLILIHHTNTFSLQINPNSNNFKPQINQNPKQSNSANSSSKLSIIQINICKSRQALINKSISSIISIEENQLNEITSIILRTESLYNQQNKSIPNYEFSINQLGSIQTKAYSDFSVLNYSSTFSCSLNDPIGYIKIFQNNLKTEISDLNSLRDSALNLINAFISSQAAH